MANVPTYRLYALRIVYFLILLFIGSSIWPGMLHHTRIWPPMEGVARSMLAAVGVMAALGIRFPLQMLPVLFFELAWKSIWLIVIGIPLWSANHLDPDNAETFKACAIGLVVFSAAVPWRYVFTTYFGRPVDAGQTPGG